MKKPLALFAVLLMLASILPQGTARADTAPPEAQPVSTASPAASNPLCGSPAIILLPLAGMFIISHRKRKG